MRVAFFSPLPPARSGIADYSEALIHSLKPLVEMEVFSGPGQAYDPARFDIALYHVGNNPHHTFVYETALRYPGVVVMHESNLHHLMADLTIKRGDWDGYLRECEYEGGAAALEFAGRVRKLEVGPDYEGVRMTKRILAAARGVVVHSRYMREEVRAAGFAGPTAVIPHGAWIPQADRNGFRHKLGLDEATPLVGIFGYLKPYKRIAESLRAFRRVLRLVPNVKMILVGEPHPEFPVEAMIRSMDLAASVRVLGFAPIADFVGYLGACDIVLNLRFPTVGESSGTLLRSLGLGKAVMVSEVGSFQEFPDDVCLKVPVGAGEEDLIFEYLNLLVSRPDVARQLGGRARDYVARECNWAAVAAQYAGFLEAVVQGKEWAPDVGSETREHGLAGREDDFDAEARSRGGRGGGAAGTSKPGNAEPAEISGLRREAHAPLEGRPERADEESTSQPTLEYLQGWAVGEASAGYLATHSTRLLKTLEITPPGSADERVLEMGAYLQITPALRNKLGYGEVRGCYYGKLGRSDHRTVTNTEGETFACEIDHFDAEKDVFPYPDGHFATVICGELIEHLFEDPMHLMSEVNRILKPGGHLVLTTPNIAALRGIAGILQGYHPGFFHAYIRPADGTGEVDARHNREYTPREINQLLENSGFEVTLLETGEFRDEPHPEFGWILHLLERYRLSTELRGDGIYAVGRKTGAVRERYPAWLYA
ncbi:MAG: methyltransferase domain-containing protein [Candidatus Solibacter sp.]|jgi:glycosyltransferase involved in cell wall biosynthesis/SAM-dependent methyltransferase